MEVSTSKRPDFQLSPALAGAPGKPHFSRRTAFQEWARTDDRKKRNAKQERYLLRIAKTAENVENLAISLKAAASLHFCNRRHIVEKVGDDHRQVGTFYCGKKYCSHCANRKRRKLLAIFQKFFQHSDKGRDILNNYDLALFTVTLQHSRTGKRKDPYYKELSEHWRNALKYGSFKKYIHGGFYNTEHTYGQNGHHIHRHALVLIPIHEHVRVRYERIEQELREQWKSRTGGSFQINLTPLGAEKDEKGNIEYVPSREELIGEIGKHLMEVTKYITKRDSSGQIHWEIVKAVEQNCRSKFYGRFGILHRIKELKMNPEREQVEAEPGQQRELYIGNCVVVRSRKKNEKGNPISYHFENLLKIPDRPEEFGRFADSIRWGQHEWKQKMWNNYREVFNGKKYTVKEWKENHNSLSRFRDNGWTTAIVPAEIPVNEKSGEPKPDFPEKSVEMPEDNWMKFSDVDPFYSNPF